MEEDEIGKRVVDVAVRIHRDLGPGLLEVVYEVILAHELRGKGLRVERQVAIPIAYRGVKFAEGFRIDLIVEHRVIIELKADKRLGYLLNFGAAVMKDGIVRVANRLSEPSA